MSNISSSSNAPQEGTQNTEAQGASPPSPPPPPTASQQTTPSNDGTSTIQKSDKKSTEDTDAQSPPLIPPQQMFLLFNMINSMEEEHLQTINDEAIAVNNANKRLLAQQDAILNMLKKWVEQTHQKGETDLVDARKDYERKQAVQIEIVRDYIADISSGKQHLDQSTLSIVLAGIISGAAVQIPMIINQTTGVATLDLARDSLMPLGGASLTNTIQSLGAGLPVSIQSGLTLDLTQVMANTSAACAYWNMAAIASSGVATANASDVSATATKAYARTLVEFVMQPNFDAFVKSRILRHIDLATTPPEKLQAFTASMKTLLLASALAALDKAETGGVIIRGADMKALLEGTVQPPLAEGDMRLVLVKLIHEQLNLLPPETQNKLKTSMLAYFDTNPNMQALTDPAQSLIALFNPQFTNQTALSQPG